MTQRCPPTRDRVLGVSQEGCPRRPGASHDIPPGVLAVASWRAQALRTRWWPLPWLTPTS